MNKTFMRSSTS